MGSVHLELLGEAHLGALGAMLSDPDVLRFTRVPEPTPADFPQQWLATYEAGRRDGTREAFAALDGDGRLVGLALAFGIDLKEGEAELGYIVAPEDRRADAAGAGYAREGVMRSVHFKNGRRIDAVLLSRLRSDPAPP